MLVPNDIRWVEVQVPLADVALDILRGVAISCGKSPSAPSGLCLRCPEGCSDIMLVNVRAPKSFCLRRPEGCSDLMWIKVRAPLADFALDVLRDVAISCGQKSECP